MLPPPNKSIEYKGQIHAHIGKMRKAQNCIITGVFKPFKTKLTAKGTVHADTCKIKTHKSVLF